MAKIKLGALITGASGKLGGQMVGTNNGTLILKNKPSKKSNATAKQTLQRKNTLKISQFWRELGTEKQQLFSEQVNDYIGTDIFSDKKIMNGYQLFKKLNQGRLFCDLDLLSSPNEVHKPNLYNEVTITAQNDSLILNSDNFDSYDYVAVYATGPVRVSQSNFSKKYKKIGIINGDQFITGVDMYLSYINIFGYLDTDTNVAFAFKTFSAISGFSNGVLYPKRDLVTVIDNITDYSDFFNRPNGKIGSNWSANLKWPNNVVIDNLEVKSNNGGPAGVFWNAGTFDDNQYSQVTITDVTGNYAGPIVRADTTKFIVFGNTTTQVRIIGVTSSYVSVFASANYTIQNGDVMRVEIENDLIKGFVNGVLIVSRLRTGFGSGAAGLFCQQDQRLDNWFGGSL